MKRRLHAAFAALGLLSASAGTLAADVAITYSVMPEQDDGVMARGRIVLQLTNVSGRPMEDVSVRAVLSGGGQLSGAVLDSVDLAQGEIAVLHGEYITRQELTALGTGWPFSVTYRGEDGQPQPASISVVFQD